MKEVIKELKRRSEKTANYEKRMAYLDSLELIVHELKANEQLTDAEEVELLGTDLLTFVVTACRHNTIE